MHSYLTCGNIRYGPETACEPWKMRKVRSSGVLPLPRSIVIPYILPHEAGHPTQPQRIDRHEREWVSLGPATDPTSNSIQAAEVPREKASKYYTPCIRLTLHYITPCLFSLLLVYQPTMSVPVAIIEWPVPKSETIPRPVKVSHPFCFDDSQVVLQASRILPPVILLSI